MNTKANLDLTPEQIIAAKRTALLEMLRGEVSPVITFTKTDGTERRMWATTLPKYIPEAFQPKGDSKVKENPNTIRCFDLDKQEWRSFRVDSVTSVTV